jgi:hypothetical protein
MRSDPPSANGPLEPGALPPVEPPNPRFIAQLFLVPGLLVALVVGFIWVFFGWLGTSTQDAEKLLSLVETSPSDLQRWKAAQDLAQLLPRDEELRCNVRFALKVAEVLERERLRPLPPSQDENAQREQTPDLLKFLPGVAAHFYAPVGLPVMQAIVAENCEKLQDEVRLLRLRNAVVAIGNLGAKVQEYDALPAERKERLCAALEQEAGETPGRAAWARIALAYLKGRDSRYGIAHAGGEKAERDLPRLAEPFGVISTLGRSARAADELTRKYTASALANWDEPAAEPILRQLAGDQSDLPNEAFEKNEKAPFTEQDRARGEREIRYNAALALARRGSPLTPWSLIEEILDEDGLRQRYTMFNAGRASGNDANNSTLAAQCTVKALRDLGELKRTQPAIWDQQNEVVRAVRQLAEKSSNMVVQVEAQKLLGSSADATIAGARVSREVLLMVAVGGIVVLFLALAAIARWRRKPLTQSIAQPS